MSLSRAAVGGTAALLALLIVALLCFAWASSDRPGSVTIATGLPCSPYDLLGKGLATAVSKSESALGATTLSTTGSDLNALLVEDGEVQFGFVHDRTPASPHLSLRTVARLYDDRLQLVVRSGADIETMADLDGKRIGLGLCQTAERRLAETVLYQYGIDIEPWPPCPLSQEDRVKTRARPAESLDAEAFVSGLPSTSVSWSLARVGMGRPEDHPWSPHDPAYAACEQGEPDFTQPGGRFLSLTDPGSGAASLEGLGLVLDGVRAGHIPARTYGSEPGMPVTTVSIGVLLVAHADVPAPVVEQVTRTLIENRFTLSASHPEVDRIEELRPDAALRFPLHPGAAEFYARHEPHPLFQWSELLNLVVAVLATTASGAFALSRWLRRRKKNRIDVFYLELERISDDIRGIEGPEAFDEIERRLLSLRKRAFEELVAERLDADESFTIFESSLSHRLRELAHRRG